MTARTFPAALLIAVLTCAHAQASAEEAADSAPFPGWGYLVDGGAVPFVYGSLLGVVTLELLASPPATPRFFDPDEGGATARGDTVPEAAVTAFVSLSWAGVAVMPTPSRWYHFKGLGQSVATTWLVTTLAKDIVGRHRPHFDVTNPDAEDEDSRSSFFSAHASMTLATTTYLGLYLHQHVFARYRAPGSSLAWWEVFPYAGLAAASVYVPVSRVQDKRHHASDVLTGSLVGASMSVAFYAWQERRFSRSRDRQAEAQDGAQLAITPTVSWPGAAGAAGITLSGRF